MVQLLLGRFVLNLCNNCISKYRVCWMKIFRFKLVFILFLLINQVIAEERVQGRRSLVLENEIARLVIDIAG